MVNKLICHAHIQTTPDSKPHFLVRGISNSQASPLGLLGLKNSVQTVFLMASLYPRASIFLTSNSPLRQSERCPALQNVKMVISYQPYKILN